MKQKEQQQQQAQYQAPQQQQQQQQQTVQQPTVPSQTKALPKPQPTGEESCVLTNVLSIFLEAD